MKKDTRDTVLGGIFILIVIIFFYTNTEEEIKDDEIKTQNLKEESLIVCPKSHDGCLNGFALDNNVSVYVNREKIINKIDYKNNWAFKENSVTLGCVRYPIIYVYDSHKIKYGLNGRSHREFKKPVPNNETFNNKMIEPFLDEAINLCNPFL